jgi:hypothetical protein
LGWYVVMAVKSLDGTSARRYSIKTRRSHIAMVARRALHRMNGPASQFFFRPFVVMAARALGPGPTRLKLVKLAHNLGGHQTPAGPIELNYVEDRGAGAEPTQRAA